MLGERRVFGHVYRVPKEDHLRPDSRQRRRLNGIVVHFGLGLDSAQVEIGAHGERRVVIKCRLEASRHGASSHVAVLRKKRRRKRPQNRG